MEKVCSPVRRRRFSTGYSLIELVILFVVLAIVSIFIWVNREYFIAEPGPGAEKLTTELIRMAINNYALESQALRRQPMYPRTLDDALIGTVASDQTPLFIHVLPEGIRAVWKKVGANQYVYQLGNPNKKVEIDDIYFYDAGSGSFGKGERFNRSVTARVPLREALTTAKSEVSDLIYIRIPTRLAHDKAVQGGRKHKESYCLKKWRYRLFRGGLRTHRAPDFRFQFA